MSILIDWAGHRVNSSGTKHLSGVFECPANTIIKKEYFTFYVDASDCEVKIISCTHQVGVEYAKSKSKRGYKNITLSEIDESWPTVLGQIEMYLVARKLRNGSR